MAEFGMSEKQIDILLNFAAQHPSLAFSKPGKRKFDQGFSYFLWKEVGRELNYSYDSDKDWKAYNYWPVIWKTLKQKARNSVQYYKRKFLKAGKLNVSWDEYPIKEYQKTILKLNESFQKGELSDDYDHHSDDEPEIDVVVADDNKNPGKMEITPDVNPTIFCEPDVVQPDESNPNPRPTIPNQSTIPRIEDTNPNETAPNDMTSLKENFDEIKTSLKTLTNMSENINQNIISLQRSMEAMSESMVTMHYMSSVNSEYYRQYGYY